MRIVDVEPVPTINGTSTALWIDLTRPNVGVVPPPAPRFAHTSSLSAPALVALFKWVAVRWTIVDNKLRKAPT